MKKLDQSVFANLPPAVCYAAVDADGTASAFTRPPELDGSAWLPANGDRTTVIGSGQRGEFDASYWSNSLISRQQQFQQLSQDITAREHYAFELVKIALAENAYVGEELRGLIQSAYRIADSFIELGRK